jgi:hypothetical protein
MKNLPQLDTPLSFELNLENEEKQPAEDFNAIVLGAVDSALSVLGENSKQAVYNYMEKKCNLSREVIPSRISDFAGALDKVFGKAALVLEVRIMHELHEKAAEFKYHPSAEGLSLAGYVEGLRDFL